MRIRLDYGKTGIGVNVPDAHLAGVLGLRPVTALPDVDAAVTRALLEPIGSSPLCELAEGKRSACIVICDITRPVPNREVLSPILRTLLAAGIPKSRTEIVIATGTHRPNEGEELVHLVGAEIAAQYPCFNHVCTNGADLRYLGTSPNGVPIWLNRHYLDAELKITAGMIEPHFMAGYAGGRKMVMPGVAGLETVQAWHSPRFLEHPRATNGAVEGNPVHEEALAIVRLSPPDFMVDVSLDESKRPWGVFAGHFERAWEAGVRAVSEIAVGEVSAPVDIVVTSGGGFPLDLTYYQTVKAMVGAIPILKPGGAVIVASECSEGVGNAHFKETLLATRSISDFLPQIESPDWKVVADQWQVEELAIVCRRGRMLLKSGLDSDLAARLFVEPVGDLDAAVRAEIDRVGAGARVAVIPKGPYVIARVG